MNTTSDLVIQANVGIIAHADADGICSSAIIKTKHPGALILFSKASQLHKTIREIDRWARTLDILYIVDIAINPNTFNFVLDRLEKVKSRYKVIYIDNHLLPWEIPKTDIDPIDIKDYVNTYIRKENWSSSALAFSHLFGESREAIIQHRKPALLGAYGAIADYARQCSYLSDVFGIWDESIIYYQAFLLKQACRVINSNDLKRTIADKLSVGILPSEIGEVVDAAREASREVDVAIQYIQENATIYGNLGLLVECPVASMGHNAFVTATMTEQAVGVAISRKSGNTYFVLRRRHNETIHLGELATMVAHDLDCDGGGEEATAGITADDSMMVMVLDRLNYYIQDYIAGKGSNEEI